MLNLTKRIESENARFWIGLGYPQESHKEN